MHTHTLTHACIHTYTYIHHIYINVYIHIYLYIKHTTDKGLLFSWGISRYGQCGHGDRTNVREPKKIRVDQNAHFVDVSCGDRHTVALSNKGKVYSFGWCVALIVYYVVYIYVCVCVCVCVSFFL